MLRFFNIIFKNNVLNSRLVFYCPADAKIMINISKFINREKAHLIGYPSTYKNTNRQVNKGYLFRFKKKIGQISLEKKPLNLQRKNLKENLFHWLFIDDEVIEVQTKQRMKREETH